MGNLGMSLVIPIFNMKTYLPDLLDSLSAQAEVACPIQIVFVDDGSTDGGDVLVEEWIRGSRYFCQLIRQENGGVSRARNRGLDAAVGDWVTFPDSDDVLDSRYLERSWAFLRSKRARRATLVASRVLRLNEPTARITDDHPLRFRFENGAQVVDMLRRPDFFQLHAASTFFRREDVIRTGARFPEGVAISEDAMFIVNHLLASPEARLGINPSAIYLYRRRARDSTIARYIEKPESAYRARFEQYASILRRAAVKEAAPVWLQAMVLYELHWALAPWQRIGSSRPNADLAMRQAILDAFSECAQYLEEDVVTRYDATALSVEARLVILALGGSAPPDWVPDNPDCVDVESGRTRWRRWEVGGDGSTAIPPEGHKQNWRRSIVYFSVTPLQEAYEWRAGVYRGRVQDRTVQADRARRTRTGQRAFALSSRAGDMRVRRVRWRGSRPPTVALVTWTREALRRSLLSRTRLRAMRADFRARKAGPLGRPVIISADGRVSADLREAAGMEPIVVTPAGVEAAGPASVIRRADRIFSDDPLASLAVLARVRPQYNQWDLTLLLRRPWDHDTVLAVTEVRAARVRLLGQDGTAPA